MRFGFGALLLVGCWLSSTEAHAVELPFFATGTDDDGVARATARQNLDVPLAPELRGCRLTTVRLRGLHRTHDHVVLRELVVRVAAPLAQPALRESVRRLRNLGVFRRVDAVVEVDDAAAVALPAGVTRCRLTLRFDEKWTLLPIVSAGRGGAVNFLTLGVQDIHLLGRLLSLEAFWQNFGGVNSAGLVFADPRLLDRRIHVGLTAALLRRNRARFDPGAPGAPAAVASLAPYSRHRWQFGVEAADVRRPERIWRASLWWLDDRFDTSILEPDDAARAQVLGVPARRRWLMLGLGGRLGRIDFDDYLERGATLDLALLAGLAPGDAAPAGRGFVRAALTGKLALLPHRRFNVVARLSVQAIDHVVDEIGVYVGGLDGVRGLPDSRYLGRVAAVANFELRSALLHGRWLALQNAVFVDVGHAADDVTQLFRPVVPLSGGTGLRLIIPTIARFVARADVAWASTERGGWLLSFGAQQAF